MISKIWFQIYDFKNTVIHSYLWQEKHDYKRKIIKHDYKNNMIIKMTHTKWPLHFVPVFRTDHGHVFIIIFLISSRLLTLRAFAGWTTEAFYQGVMIYFISTMFFGGKIVGTADFGVGCYTTIVLVVTSRLSVETSCWTWLTHLIIWGTIGSYLIFGLIYSSTVWTFGSHGADLYWIMQVMQLVFFTCR